MTKAVKARCSKCREWKEISNFGRDKSHSNGRHSWCNLCMNENVRQRHNKRVEQGLCAQCGKQTIEKTRFCSSCKESHKIYHKKHQQRIKLETFNAYGGAFCVCCGETAMEFLSIDHIGGGGNKHRREIRKGTGLGFYHWLRKNNYPTGYQVLCINCNFAKAHFDSCPHEKKIDFFNLPIEDNVVMGTGA